MLSALGSEGLVPPMMDECDCDSASAPESPSASDESECADGEWEFLDKCEATEGVGVERTLEGGLEPEVGGPNLCQRFKFRTNRTARSRER